MANEWRVGNAVGGLFVQMLHDSGKVLRAPTHDDAREIVAVLNSLEESAAFGHQCYQDRCENAYIEASVVKRLEKEKAELGKIINAAKNYVESAIAEEKATDEEEQEAAEERTTIAWEELCLRLPQ